MYSQRRDGELAPGGNSSHLALASPGNIPDKKRDTGYASCLLVVLKQCGLLQGLNHDECLLYTCVVWITIALSPSRSVVRWATKGGTPTTFPYQSMAVPNSHVAAKGLAFP